MILQGEGATPGKEYQSLLPAPNIRTMAKAASCNIIENIEKHNARSRTILGKEWYENSGSLRLDCFTRGVVDSKRLRDDYVPSGWKGPGVKTRAVKGHEFGLSLAAEDKRALIGSLRTL